MIGRSRNLTTPGNASVVFEPLSEASDIPPRHRRRIEKWRRKHPTGAAFAFYKRYPPYGIANNLAKNYFSVDVTILGFGLKRWKTVTLQYTTPWPRVKVVEAAPGQYRLEQTVIAAGNQVGSTMTVSLEPGQVFEVYARAERRWLVAPRSRPLINRVFSGVTNAGGPR